MSKLVFSFLFIFGVLVMDSSGKSSIEIQLIDFNKDIKTEMLVSNTGIPEIEFYGLPFEITDLTIEKNIITVQAKTRNTDNLEKLIHSFAYSNGNSPLVLTIDIPRKEMIPPVPQVPPAIVKWMFPAMCELQFTASLNLDDYIYTGTPKVTVTATLGLKQKYNTYDAKVISLPKR